jgi:hypothetical protein
MLRRFERELTDQRDWHTVQAGLDVKQVAGPDGKEVFILARSADRQAKEQAMHQRLLQRLETGLRKLESAMSTGHLQDEGLANRRLGRLQEQNWRASGAYDIRIERLAQPVGKARLKMTWERNPSWNQWASIAEGCYVLRSNLCGVEPVTLWKRYIQLTDAEWAFRIAKDELCIRPVWHQKEDRVRAHIPGVLPGVCLVEEPGGLDAARGSGRRSAHASGGARQNQERRPGPPGTIT